MKRRPNNHKKRTNCPNPKHSNQKHDWNSGKKTGKYGSVNALLDEESEELEQEEEY